MDAPNVGEGEPQRYNRRNETGFLNVVPSINSHHDALVHGKHEGDWNNLDIWRSIPSLQFFCCWSNFLVPRHPQKKQAWTGPELSEDALPEEAPSLNSKVGLREKVLLIWLKPRPSSFPGRICRSMTRVEVRHVVTSRRPIPLLPALNLMKTPVLLKLQRPTLMSNSRWRHPVICPLQDPGISSMSDIHGERIPLAKVQRNNCFLVLAISIRQLYLHCRCRDENSELWQTLGIECGWVFLKSKGKLVFIARAGYIASILVAYCWAGANGAFLKFLTHEHPNERLNS